MWPLMEFVLSQLGWQRATDRFVSRGLIRNDLLQQRLGQCEKQTEPLTG